MQDLQTWLQSGQLLIADGAAGTMLQSMGLKPGQPPELWNAENPMAVRSLHRAYLTGGSQVILTNTFGGNGARLRMAGLLDRLAELNRAGAALAREEAADRAYVAGDIGPTGELLKPYGKLEYADAVESFRAQAAALVEGGVDLLWVETMSDVREAQAAIEAVHAVTDHLPIFCSLSFGKRARTIMGTSPREAADALWPMGLAAIGANCGEGVDVMEPVLTEMRAALPGAVLIAKPNAGMPRLEQGRTVYDLGPEEFAARGPELVALGAQVIGACCGSSPAHIAALATRLREATKA
jgi:5-methyltetrahydrofolate--homocysteine methyltransferase